MTDQPEDQLAVVLGQRQLIAVCCMCLVVMGLVATLSYVTGRSITAAQMRNADESMSTPPIIVDPTKSQSFTPTPLETRAQNVMPTGAPVTHTPVVVKPVAPTPTPAVVKPTPPPPVVVQAIKAAPPPPAPVKATPAPVKPVTTPAPEGVYQPKPGRAYWQVGIVEATKAAAFTDAIARLGLEVHLTPSASAEGRKVLVGPYDGDDIEKSRRALAANGYQYFLRRF